MSGFGDQRSTRLSYADIVLLVLLVLYAHRNLPDHRRFWCAPIMMMDTQVCPQFSKSGGEPTKQNRQPVFHKGCRFLYPVEPLCCMGLRYVGPG